MKVLVISQTGDFLGVAQRLVYEGHSVSMWIKEPAYKRSGKGIVNRIDSWRSGLKDADLAIVDMVGMGAQTETAFRAVGVPFIGASPQMDKLELERAFGMKVFEDCGISLPESHAFDAPEEARSFFNGLEFGDGWCIKADDNLGCATSRLIKEPEQLDWAFAQYPDGIPLLVQRIVKGVEVSTEGWFNGSEWVRPFNHTFEEKRFLEGGLGPNTGCMGNVVVGCPGCKLTRATVEKLKPFLTRIGWRGPVDVNCIVDSGSAYALEATARFGYDAIEALLEGVRLSAGDFLREVAAGTLTEFEFAGPSIAVRLSVPPYPSEDDDVKAEWGEPILGINQNNINHLWLCNVMVEGDLFRTSGADGLTLKATARGDGEADIDKAIALARRRVYRTLDNIRVGSKMYRRDIGSRVAADLAQLREWGWCK